MESSVKQSDQSRKAILPLVAGLCGGATSTALLLPLDNIKVRLQVHEGEIVKGKDSQKRLRLGSIRMLRGVIRHEGVSGLYQGLVPAVIGSAVSWGGFFFVYEHFKNELRRRKATNSAIEEYSLSSWDNFVLACASGGVMVVLTNPVWLIKLRMQLQMKNAAEHVSPSIKPYKGMVDATRTIVREEGFWALYKGAGPGFLLTSHGGVQFVVYEFLRKHFHYVRAQREVDPNLRSSVLDRLEKSAGYLTMGAISKV